MRSAYLVCIALYLLVFISNSLARSEPAPAASPPSTTRIQIATDLWPGFTEPNQQGAYLHLLQLIFPLEAKLDIHFTSFGRSILLAEQQQVHLVIGISATDSTQLLLSDWPFDVDQIAILFLSGSLNPTDKDQLNGLKVASQRGYNFAQNLNIDIDSYEVDSIRTGVNLVRSQRVDAFLVEKTELKSKLMAEDLAGLELAFLKGEPIYVGFSNNETGQQLKAWWDQTYQQLYHSGQLQPLYQQYPNFILPVPGSNHLD